MALVLIKVNGVLVIVSVFDIYCFSNRCNKIKVTHSTESCNFPIHIFCSIFFSHCFFIFLSQKKLKLVSVLNLFAVKKFFVDLSVSSNILNTAKFKAHASTLKVNFLSRRFLQML